MSSWMAWRYRLGITGLLRIRMRRVGIEGDDAEREWYRFGGTLARTGRSARHVADHVQAWDDFGAPVAQTAHMPPHCTTRIPR